MAERKFLQETNFQEDEFDEDILPERRSQEQMWRLNTPPVRPRQKSPLDE